MALPFESGVGGGSGRVFRVSGGGEVGGSGAGVFDVSDGVDSGLFGSFCLLDEWIICWLLVGGVRGLWSVGWFSCVEVPGSGWE